MTKELEALQELRDLVEYLTRVDFVPTELRNEVKELLIKHYEKSNGYFSQIEQALKRNEPMKVANRTETEEGHYEVEKQGYISGRHYLITITSGECPVCGEPMDDRENIVPPIFCPHCGQKLDWTK